MKKQKGITHCDKEKEQGTATNNEAANTSENRIITDPFGSWTGVPTDDKYEMPIQDVDDL